MATQSFPLLAVMPHVGETVSVEIPNTSPARHNPLFRDMPESHTYVGIVMSPFPWLTNMEFCMSSDDPEMPVRVINIEYVCKIEGSKSTNRPAAQKVTNEVKRVMVQGSKGNQYVVTVTGNKATCTCPQNQIRRQVCKHIQQVLGNNG